MRDQALRDAEEIVREIEEMIVAFRIDMADLKGSLDRIESGFDHLKADLDLMLATTLRMAESIDRVERRLEDQVSRRRCRSNKQPRLPRSGQRARSRPNDEGDENGSSW